MDAEEAVVSYQLTPQIHYYTPYCDQMHVSARDGYFAYIYRTKLVHIDPSGNVTEHDRIKSHSMYDTENDSSKIVKNITVWRNLIAITTEGVIHSIISADLTIHVAFNLHRNIGRMLLYENYLVTYAEEASIDLDDEVIYTDLSTVDLSARSPVTIMFRTQAFKCISAMSDAMLSRVGDSIFMTVIYSSETSNIMSCTVINLTQNCVHIKQNFKYDEHFQPRLVESCGHAITFMRRACEQTVIFVRVDIASGTIMHEYKFKIPILEIWTYDPYSSWFWYVDDELSAVSAWDASKHFKTQELIKRLMLKKPAYTA